MYVCIIMAISMESLYFGYYTLGTTYSILFERDIVVVLYMHLSVAGIVHSVLTK